MKGVLCYSCDHSKAGMFFIDIAVLTEHHKKELKMLYVLFFPPAETAFPMGCHLVLNEEEKRDLISTKLKSL